MSAPGPDRGWAIGSPKDAPDVPVVRRTMSRRAFLVVGAGGAITATGFTRLAGRFSTVELPHAADLLATPALTKSYAVRRAADQCVLTIDLYNMEADYSGKTPVIRQPHTSELSYLSVTLHAQHVADESYILTDANAHALKKQPDLGSQPARKYPSTQPEAPPVDSVVSGGTQLVFIVPAGLMAPNTATPLPFDTATILDWSTYAMNVVPNAVPQGEKPKSLARPSAPTGPVTAIELPYRVQISPVGSVAWVNSTAPVTSSDGWTELWHTRLAAFSPAGPTVGPVGDNLDDLQIYENQWFEDDAHRDERTIRAIWCLDEGFAGTLTATTSAKTSLPATDTPFNMSLQPRDRGDIVRLSSDFALVAHNRTTSTGAPFVPSAATVDRMILTAYGATMDLEDHWDLGENPAHDAYNSSLLQWRHRTSGGRDTYVRVVRKGYIFPFGHRASLVTINERMFSSIGSGSGSPGAYLRERIFIVIGQPIKNYATSPYIPQAGRKFPFTALEVVTLTTPNLDAETKFVTTPGSAFSIDAPYCFQPKIGGQPFLFHFRGTDYDGNLTDFRAPVAWVDDTIAYGGSATSPAAPSKTNTQVMDAIKTAWGKLPLATRTIDARRARISIAPSMSAGDTNVSVESFELGVEGADAPSTIDLINVAQADFVPSVDLFTLHMPEVQTMSGNNVGGPQLEYNSTYLDYGFDGYVSGPNGPKPNPSAANPGELLLSRPSSIASSPGVKFNAGKSGGAVTPNFSIDAYTRTLGPTGAAQGGDISSGLANLAKGKFDPKAIFDAANAHLLGGIPLSAILGQMGFGSGSTTPGQAMQLTNRQTGPNQITTLLDWQPPITPGGPTIAGQTVDIFFPVPDGTKYEGTGQPDDPGVPGLFDLHAVVITDLSDASRSTYSIVGQLQSFELDLFGDGSTYFLQIPINSLTFHAQKDKKTEVQVDVGDVAFEGTLSFVQDMASYLNFDGSGLTISTEGSGITVDLQVSIPTIAIGVLSIANIAFDAGCIIPYNGDPVAFTFSFCTRENQFSLSVMGFEGGGFVGLAITAKGLEMLEFSFEFGLSYSINIGIASGSIYLEGGIYFEISTRGDGTQDLEFTAFVKAGGGVSALGIVSVSVELYLSLGYKSGDCETGTPPKLRGEADLTVSVHVLFFGGSFTIGMSEEFDAGSAGPCTTSDTSNREAYVLTAESDTTTQEPMTFGDMITSADLWSQYTTAFVPAGG